MVAASDAIVFAQVVVFREEHEQLYAVIHPIEQIKGTVGEQAHLLIGYPDNRGPNGIVGESKVFTLTPGSFVILCLKAETTKNVYRDAGAGRGTMPVLPVLGKKLVEVDTTTVTNVPAKKLERAQAGLSNWEGWRDYYSFYDCSPFLAALKKVAAKNLPPKSASSPSNFIKNR